MTKDMNVGIEKPDFDRIMNESFDRLQGFTWEQYADLCREYGAIATDNAMCMTQYTGAGSYLQGRSAYEGLRMFIKENNVHKRFEGTIIKIIERIKQGANEHYCDSDFAERLILAVNSVL